MSTMNVNVELFRQLSYIADDENYMRKALNYIKKLVVQKEKEEQAPFTVAEEEAEYRPLTKEEVLAGLDQACKEAKLYKEGKLQLKSWEEVYNEL